MSTSQERRTKIEISLVLCTRNRASQLKVALESVVRLENPNIFEVVIVNNGSTDETQETIESFRSKFTYFQTVTEPQAGLGRARNCGWKAASGEIIAFTDDDCYPQADYLTAMLSCFAENDQLGFVGGRILLHDPTDYPITIQEREETLSFEPGDFVSPGLIQGANFACRKSALDSVEGFDVLFGHGSYFPCEDIDVLARILAHGYSGLYDPRPLVYHHHGRKTESEALDLMRQYDRGCGAYYVKCVLNAKTRQPYFKRWLRNIRKQSFRRTWRELIAGFEYLLRSAMQRTQ